ncbi:MAG TPA: DUF6703 family protein [Mycobacteriales bacterium]|nr:DUF6703 family protein [Mycobacteriales bacterium]
MTRRTFEQRTGPLLVVVSRLPRAVPFLVVAALLISGLLVQGAVGGLLLLVLAVLLGGLLALSWPVLQPGPRLLRLAVVGIVLVRGLSFLL